MLKFHGTKENKITLED